MKALAIDELERLIEQRQVQAMYRAILKDDDEEDDSDDDQMEMLIDLGLQQAYEKALSSRYMFPRKPYRKGNAADVFMKDLQTEDNEDGTPPWLNEDEFLQKYRMHRDSFNLLVDKIKDHPVFQNNSHKPQAPVAWQLMVFLFYIGKANSGASNPTLRHVFGIGRGTAETFKRRCIKAIRSLRDEAIQWPDETERLLISARIWQRYQWLNCVAVADGTLFPLMVEPQSIDAPNYHGRKFQYSMSCLVVNDDTKRIRYYLSGFPGCAHDNRVYRNSDLAERPNEFFGNHQFLVGDSAYANSKTVVSSFKKPKGHQLTEEQEAFNFVVTQLDHFRVIRAKHLQGIAT